MEKTDCVLWCVLIMCIAAIIVSFIAGSCKINVARANRGISEVTINRDEIVRPPLDTAR